MFILIFGVIFKSHQNSKFFIVRIIIWHVKENRHVYRLIMNANSKVIYVKMDIWAFYAKYVIIDQDFSGMEIVAINVKLNQRLLSIEFYFYFFIIFSKSVSLAILVYYTVYIYINKN